MAPSGGKPLSLADLLAQGGPPAPQGPPPAFAGMPPPPLAQGSGMGTAKAIQRKVFPKRGDRTSYAKKAKTMKMR